MSKGSTKQFYYDSSSVNNPSISWNTENAAIATVDSTGKVTAVNYGTTSIYVFIYYTKEDGSSGYYSRYFYIDVTLQSGTYFFNNVASDYILRYENVNNLSENAMLEVVDRGSNNYVPPNGNERYMMFKVKHLGDGIFSIRSMLDSTMGWTDNYSNLVMTTIGTSDASIPSTAKWRIKYYADGYVISPINDDDFCITGSTQNYQDITIEYYQSSRDEQKWNVTKITQTYQGVDIICQTDTIVKNESFEFTAVMYSTNLTENGSHSYVWSVTNGTGTATVNSSSGIVTGTELGTVTVTVTYGGVYSQSVVVDIIPIAEGIYFFENVGYSNYMQIDKAANPMTSQGAIFGLWDFDGENYQKFSIEYVGDLYYKIICVHSGKVLTAPSAANNNVTQTTYANLDTQKWYIAMLGGGTCKLYPKSNGTFCMAAGTTTLTDNGRNVEVRTEQANDGDSDEWKLELVTNAYKITLCGISNVNHDHLSGLEAVKIILNGSDFDFVALKSGAISASDCLAYLKGSNVFTSRSHGHLVAWSGSDTPISTGIVLNDADDEEMVALYSNIWTGMSTGSRAISSTDSFAELKLVLFIGCETAYGGEGVKNLPSVAVNNGAEVAIGFSTEIICGDANLWTAEFYGRLLEGDTVQEAVNYASGRRSTESGLKSAVVCGNGNYRLGD